MKTKNTNMVVSLGNKTAMATFKKNPKKAKTEKEFTLENFLKPGYFGPQDFNVDFEIHRIQRERCDEAKLRKIFSEKNNTDAKIEAAYKKHGNPFTKINSWYYVLNTKCVEFDAFTSDVLRNEAQLDEAKRKEIYQKLADCQTFGIVKALLYAKRGYQYDLPKFKSLKHCQEWCDKHGIEINAREIYKKTSTTNH